MTLLYWIVIEFFKELPIVACLILISFGFHYSMILGVWICVEDEIISSHVGWEKLPIFLWESTMSEKSYIFELLLVNYNSNTFFIWIYGEKTDFRTLYKLKSVPWVNSCKKIVLELGFMNSKYDLKLNSISW